MKTVCIMCPVGCDLNIEKVGDKVVVTGNACIRGEQYGIAELTNPVRMVTTLVKTDLGVLPVKTTDVVPKDKYFLVIDKIKELNLKSAKSGDIIIKNVLNLNVDVVVTGNY